MIDACDARHRGWNYDRLWAGIISQVISEVMGDTNLSNLSEEKNISVLIQETLGDSHINYESLFFLTIIYSIFLVIGVLGNLSTCIVILTNEYMRTATNVYLFNLAVADVATLVISKLSFLDFKTLDSECNKNVIVDFPDRLMKGVTVQ